MSYGCKGHRSKCKHTREPGIKLNKGLELSLASVCVCEFIFELSIIDPNLHPINYTLSLPDLNEYMHV